LSFKGSSVDRSLSYGSISRQLARQALLLSSAPKQQTGMAAAGTHSPGSPIGRELARHTTPGPIEGLLAPTAGQAAEAESRSDYHFRKKKRKKKKGIHL
ncbi:MAG: hypothetical protein LPK07_03960, partial [Hymenobacteraceae bacterium]|nr:hypothetical protein [Hymenobacteraceae bacterium]